MRIRAKVEVSNADTILLKPIEEDRVVAVAFGADLAAGNKWSIIQNVDIEPWQPPGSFEQVEAFWSVVRVICLEDYRRSSRHLLDTIYRGILEEYGPPEEIERYKGKLITWRKTLSEMNWTERSQMIEGAIAEASARVGGDFHKAVQVRNYMVEWKNWRYAVKKDKLDETYQDLNDYKRRVPYCEATSEYLGSGGHLAHIVSRGAGGENFEAWNFLHLGAEPHLMLQHQKGWVAFLRLYPHLLGKVNAARERSGLPTIERPEELLDDLFRGGSDGPEEEKA